MALGPVSRPTYGRGLRGIGDVPSSSSLVPIPVGNPLSDDEQYLASIVAREVGDTKTRVGGLLFAPDGTVVSLEATTGATTGGNAGNQWVATGEVLTPSQMMLLLQNASVSDARALLAQYPNVAALAAAERQGSQAAIDAARQQDAATAQVQALVRSGNATPANIQAIQSGVPVTPSGTIAVHPSDQLVAANPNQSMTPVQPTTTATDTGLPALAPSNMAPAASGGTLPSWWVIAAVAVGAVVLGGKHGHRG